MEILFIFKLASWITIHFLCIATALMHTIVKVDFSITSYKVEMSTSLTLTDSKVGDIYVNDVCIMLKLMITVLIQSYVLIRMNMVMVML